MMDTIEKNAIFTKDTEGIIIITDIENPSRIIRGEAVYDGKNAIILNRNNAQYYVLKNIPPYLRKDLVNSDTVTVIEKRGEEDIYSYAVNVRLVNDLQIPDEWSDFSDKIVKNLTENLTPAQLNEFLSEAEKIYKNMAL